MSGTLNAHDDFGAVGDGVADDTAKLQAALDACFGPGVPSPAYKMLFIPGGLYKITAPLTMRSVQGAVISGAGRLISCIKNFAGGAVFVTNGFAYNKVENIWLQGTGTATPLFDLDWDNTGPVALQANTFQNVLFQGGGIGCRIGNSGFMGSENLFLNTHFAANAISGLSTHNFNALQNTIIGGNIAGCNIGIDAHIGNICIHNTGFQQNAAWDIAVANSSNDAMVISGCRSESLNFAQVQYQAVSVDGCSQTNGAPGYFLYNAGNTFRLSGSVSYQGQVHGNAGTISGCQFGRDDPFLIGGNGRVSVFNTMIGKTSIGVGTGTARLINEALISGGVGHTTIVPRGSISGGLSACAGGGKSLALPLVDEINIFSTVGAAGDSALLFGAVPDARATVINNGANALQLFGRGSDTINGTASAVGVSLAPGTKVTFYSNSLGAWFS